MVILVVVLVVVLVVGLAVVLVAVLVAVLVVVLAAWKLRDSNGMVRLPGSSWELVAAVWKLLCCREAAV